jgi:NADPH-dependent stearoyl-CoA 9-desaturase
MREPNTRRTQLSPHRLEAFAREIEAIRDRAFADLGERDARYIDRILTLQRSAELAGRTVLFAGALPPAWAAGVTLLSLSKILENMEIGHNVLHGQYDFMKDPRLSSLTYEWDWACPAASWRHSHNFVHHTFTNIVGKDRDVGYGLLRMADEQPWHPANLPQPLYALLQMLTFEWAVAVHDLELDGVIRGDKTLRQLARDFAPVLRKAAPQVLKDFVLFPLLAGPSAPLVLSANLSANVVRNVWAFLVIFCGHFPDGVQMFEDEGRAGSGRGAWYLRQIRGSANIDGPRWLHVLSGHLSHQIEHHLFPDLPAHRYPEIAGEVRAVCEKYGVPYNSASFAHQLGGALRRIVRCSLPPRTPAAALRARLTKRKRATGVSAAIHAA